ncbi:MAG: protein kinase [Kofleriaceae bacterium]
MRTAPGTDATSGEGTPPEQFGPYTVYEPLGTGGMATVHRAVQRGIEGFDRSVALKRLLAEFAHDEGFVKSFVREAKIAAQLRHVNCAQTYDLGKVGNVYYIAMEMVVGNDLRRILRQTATITGPMPVQLTVNLLIQLCDALEYAHNLADEAGEPLGIIHRDVSPANVIVARDGTAKLIDFGIAKASAASLATMSGQLKGKFAYMAPENLTGNIDARADLFAVGVIAHELLTARPLFAGGDDDFETLKRVRSMPIVPPSQINRDVPPDLDTIVLTALARNPDERWQSAAAMRGALQNLARQPSLEANRQDVAKWLTWAFAQTTPVPRPTTTRVRDPNDTDSPAISMDDGGDSTMDDGLVPQTVDTQPEAMLAPAKTLMFGSGVVPVAGRTTGSQPAQQPTVPTGPRSAPHVVPAAGRTTGSQPVAATPPTPTRRSAPVAAQAGGTATAAARSVSAAAPMTMPPAPPADAMMPPTDAADQPRAKGSTPQGQALPTGQGAAVMAPASSTPTAPVQVPRAPGSLPMIAIILICLGAAGIGFAVVSALT